MFWVVTHIRIESTMLRNRLAKEVNEAVEKAVRKEAYTRFLAVCDEVHGKLTPSSWRKIDVEAGEVQEADEFGFLVSEGGYNTALKGQSAAGGLGDPMEMANEVLDEETVGKMEILLADLKPLLLTYRDSVREFKDEWLQNVKDPEKVKNGIGSLIPTFGMTKGLKAMKGLIPKSVVKVVAAPINLAEKVTPGIGGNNDEEEDPDADILRVPVAIFQKAGLAAAIEFLRPKLDTMGGFVAERAAMLNLTADQRSTDMRRALDQVMQEVVIQKAHEDVFPALQVRMQEIDNIPRLILDKVESAVFDIAEQDLRKAVHDIIVSGFQDIQTHLSTSIPDTKPEAEVGDEIEEDEFGFVVREGGFKGYQEQNQMGAPELNVADLFKGFGIDPMAKVTEMLEPLQSQFSALMDNVNPMLEALENNATAAREKWLLEDGGQRLMEKAEKKGNYESVEVPVAEFLKAGLSAAMEVLQTQMMMLGGEVAEVAKNFKVNKDQRSTTMRRNLGQLLQSLVVAKAAEKVLPELEARLKDLDIPIPLIEDKVARMTRDRADVTIRKQVNFVLNESFTDISEMLLGECTAVVEKGKATEEDECGFAVKEGGFKAFKRANGGANLMDQLDDIRLEVLALQEQMDELCKGSHAWRKVFDVIKPGEVLTVDDFQFELHKVGMRLSAKQFRALVDAIDDDSDGAISYDEFMDYFNSEQGELNAQAMSADSEMVRSTWDHIDADHSGHLCEDEIRLLFGELGMELAEKEFDEALAELDVDGDGEIDYQEFAAWWKVHEQKDSHADLGKKSKKMRDTWEAVDLDGSGSLSKEEVRTMFDMMDKKLSNKKFNKAFKAMDGDGSGEIEYIEFVEWFKKSTLDELGDFRHFEGSLNEIGEMEKEMDSKQKEIRQLLALKMAEVGVPDLPGNMSPTALGSPRAGDASPRSAGDMSPGAIVPGSGAPDLGIALPSTDFHMVAIMEVVEKFKTKMASIGGIVGEKAAAIGISTDMQLTQVIRSLSQLLQVQVINLARQKIVPEIDKRVEAVGLPGRLIVKKVKSLVYEMCEKELRKTVHKTIKVAFKKANEAVSIPGCAGDADNPADDDEAEDDCGFSVSGGGYKSAQFGLEEKSGGDKKLAPMINKIIDPTLVQMLKDQLGVIGEMMQGYGAQSLAAHGKWMTEEGNDAIAEVKKVAAKFAAKGEEHIPKGKSQKDLLLKIMIPTAEFHKQGLLNALQPLKESLIEMGGVVGEFAEKLQLAVDVNALQLRRGLSQLIQEWIMDKLKNEVFPEVDIRLDDLGLMGPIATKVRELVYDMAEDITRSTIFDQIATAYDKLELKLKVPGCDVLPQKMNKKKEEEDGQRTASIFIVFPCVFTAFQWSA